MGSNKCEGGLRRAWSNQDVDAGVAALDEKHMTTGARLAKQLGRFVHRPGPDGDRLRRSRHLGVDRPRRLGCWLDAANHDALTAFDAQSFRELRGQRLQCQTQFGPR